MALQLAIFDIGGVMHESNHAVSEDLKNELGLSNDDLPELWTHVRETLGDGSATEAELWGWVAEKYGCRLVQPEENLLGRAFSRELREIPGMREIVAEVGARGVRIAALSDTIEPHERAARELGIYALFERVFLSNHIGYRKPDAAAYQTVLDYFGIEPSEAFFIDDDPNNIAGAARIGIQGILFENPQQLRRQLQLIGI